MSIGIIPQELLVWNYDHGTKLPNSEWDGAAWHLEQLWEWSLKLIELRKEGRNAFIQCCIRRDSVGGLIQGWYYECIHLKQRTRLRPENFRTVIWLIEECKNHSPLQDVDRYECIQYELWNGSWGLLYFTETLPISHFPSGSNDRSLLREQGRESSCSFRLYAGSIKRTLIEIIGTGDIQWQCYREAFVIPIRKKTLKDNVWDDNYGYQILHEGW